MSKPPEAAAGDSAIGLGQFRSPRYWPTWGLWGAMRGLASLPLALQISVGQGIGRVLLTLKRRERRTAAVNLAACFPELSPTEREELLRRHFAAVGVSFAEMATGWCWPIDRLLAIVRIEGREHLDRALAQGKGVLLASAHFTPLEVGVAVLEALAPHVSCMYRPQRNAMIDVLVRRGRSRFARSQVRRDDVRSLLRRLKENHVVAYMPDQTYLGNQSAMLPFFGVPALTNIATSKLARISGAPVLTYFFRRLPAPAGYVVEIGPPLPVTDDPEADTLAFVRRLEDFIRVAPEQYLWLYKKFKRRPPPYPNLYAAGAAADPAP